MTLYFISGLGVDKRAFIKLRLSNRYTIKYLEWIPPQAHETLSQYALRLSQAIDTTEDFSLIGLSFGGIIATEISKTLSPKQVIIISSASTFGELPLIYRLMGQLKLHKLVPPVLLKQPTFFTYWLFDAKTKEEKRLLKDILKDTSPRFLSWAIDSILKWTNRQRPETIYHIHGSKDKVLPLAHVKADAIVNGGGHLMVFSHAALISKLIEERLHQNHSSTF